MDFPLISTFAIYKIRSSQGLRRLDFTPHRNNQQILCRFLAEMHRRIALQINILRLSGSAGPNSSAWSAPASMRRQKKESPGVASQPLVDTLKQSHWRNRMPADSQHFYSHIRILQPPYLTPKEENYAVKSILLEQPSLADIPENPSYSGV